MASAFTFTGTLSYRDGWLCLKVVEPMFSEPKLVAQWWPIEHTGIGSREVLDMEGWPGSMSGGMVAFRMGHTPHAPWAASRPMPRGDDGQVRAIATEVADIPCPKVRKGIETRYWRGKWEKYLRSAGWVAA